MFTLKLLEKNLWLIISIMVFISFITIPFVYCDDNDNNRYRDDTSSVFSPGYLNAAKYQAEAVASQQEKPKTMWQNIVDYVQGNTENKVEQATVDKPKPVLQQKQSGGGGKGKVTISANAGTQIINSTNYNVKIGTGTNQCDQNGQLVSVSGNKMASEDFIVDGKEIRHIYVGFDGFGADTLTGAVGIAQTENYANSIIIVKGGGTYNEQGLSIPNLGLKIYGGYAQDGTRDISNNPTTLDFPLTLTDVNLETVIDGFTINCVGSGREFDISILSSSNVTIANSILEAGYQRKGRLGGILVPADGETCDYGISIQSSSVVIANNTFYTDGGISVAAFNVPSYVTSANNNYIDNPLFSGDATHGIFTGDLCYVSSAGDYFANAEYYNWGGIGTSLLTLDQTKPQINTGDYGEQITVAAPLTMPSQNNPAETVNYNFTDNYNQFSPMLISNFNIEANTISTLTSNMLRNTLGDKGLGRPMEISENKSKEPFAQSALSIPKYISQADVETAMRLDNILRNPTEDQRSILDVIKLMLTDTGKAQNEQASKGNPELVKAQNDLLNAVANILLAQAVPDLLKSGDISNIKTIFQELDTQKNKIMLDYSKSTRPYYESIIKDLAKNMAMLQGRNLLNPNMTKEELDKLPPSELDKILEKIKNMKDKTFEEEYILQQEAKYHKEYIDPNKKKLEYDMKDMLNSFTARLSGVLKSSEKK